MKVYNTKPNIQRLVNRGNTLVDMHFHTNYSDGLSRLRTILKRAKKLEIGIAITDHDVINGAVSAAKSKDILIIPGVEATTTEGAHILFYFYNPEELKEFYAKNIYKYKPDKKTANPTIGMIDLVEKAKDFNCIICAPHPYAAGATGICKHLPKNDLDQDILRKLDLIEVITANNTKRSNRKARILAKALDKGFTGGSDGHIVYDLGKAITLVDHPVDRIEFLEGILKKKNVVIGKETKSVRKAAVHIKAIRSLKKASLYYINKLKKIRIPLKE
jgi:predicted metal-dependent phosphoesterase TrpH